jgi:signal transduction histidine kinase
MKARRDGSLQSGPTPTPPGDTESETPPHPSRDARVRLELHEEIEKLARVGAWTNIDGRDEVVWSEGLRAIAGWPSDRRLDFHSARSGLHPDDLPAWLAARDAMDGRALEYRWIDSDGNTRWFRTRMGLSRVLGRSDTAFGIVQDISAEREVREQLRAQLELLNQIAQHVPGLMYQARGLVGGGTEITFMGGSARALLELAPHESETDPRVVFSRVHPQDLPALLADMAQCARDVTPWRNQYRVRLPSGAERWFRFEAAPSPESDGSVLWHGYIADVTEDRRARHRIERQQRLLDAQRRALQITLDSMGQGLAKIEADGRVSFYNRRMLELLNVPESLMASSPTHAEVSAYLAQRGDFGENFEFVDLLARDYVSAASAVASTGAAPSIYLRKTQAGQYLEVGTRDLPEGGAVRTITDVSSYVRSQQELAVERQRLATLNSSLERMVQERTASLERTLRDMEAIAYSIAHDLRSPLRSVNGFASVLIDTELAQLSPSGVQMLARIVNASQRMGQMLTEMLDVLAVVRADLADGDVDMAAIARDIDGQLGLRAGGVALTIDAMPMARGDEKLIKQALRNLMDNAWKYARERSPPRVHVGFDAGQGAYFVRDNGMGFDMARAAKLFGLFQRLHTDASIPGLGIGLAIASRIVERHGGRLWAESTAGEGATFWIALPMPG